MTNRHRKSELSKIFQAAPISSLPHSFVSSEPSNLNQINYFAKICECVGPTLFINFDAGSVSTERIAEVLGYCPYEEVVHRDNLAVIDRSEAPNRPCSRNS